MKSGHWLRVSKRRTCPICHHARWCLISADGTAAICPRVESDRYLGEAGWLHRLTDSTGWTSRPRRIVRADRPQAVAGLAALAERYVEAVSKDGRLHRLAAGLGLSVESLRRLRVGWCEPERCSTWPLSDAEGGIVGLNRRWPDGSKRVMARHKAGLYIPADLPLDLTGRTLLIVEGGTDSAAGLDLGRWTVGRFSCTHGRSPAIRLIRDRRPGLVAIVADADGPGRRGADRLASALLPYAACLKLIEPPSPHKDLRAWVLAGAQASELIAVIEAAPRRTLEVRHG